MQTPTAHNLSHRHPLPLGGPPGCTREPHSRRSTTLQSCHRGRHARHTRLHILGPSAPGPANNTTVMRDTQNPKGPSETPCGGDRECCTKTHVSTRQSHPRDTLTVQQPPAPATSIRLFFSSPPEILVPNQGLNPRPLQWTLRFLTAGPPGKSHNQLLASTAPMSALHPSVQTYRC